MSKSLNGNAIAACCLLIVALSAPASNAAGWGSLKGRFLVDGKPKEPRPLVVDKDEFCIKNKPTNQSLVLGKDNSLVNAIVYLRLGRGKKVDAHPDYQAALSKPVALDNHGCSFEPHVTLVRVGQTLTIKNSDPTGHNTNIAVFGFNQTIPAQSEIPIKVNVDAPLPMPVMCNIHPFMKGFVLSQKHPYMTVTGDDGSFEIKNLPAGNHEFQFWHEAAGYLKQLKFRGGATNNQGRAKLAIAAGKPLDLGDIKVKAGSFKDY